MKFFIINKTYKKINLKYLNLKKEMRTLKETSSEANLDRRQKIQQYNRILNQPQVKMLK